MSLVDDINDIPDRVLELEEENKELKRVNAYLLKIVETATKYIHYKEMPLIADKVYEQNMYNHLVKLIEKRERDLR